MLTKKRIIDTQKKLAIISQTFTALFNDRADFVNQSGAADIFRGFHKIEQSLQEDLKKLEVKK